MRYRVWPLLGAMSLWAGCATPPLPQSACVETVGHVQLVSGHVPATLPIEPELDGPHPVEFYVQLALERNPEIRAAQREVAAEAERIPQVTALDDPMLEDRFWPIPDHSPQTASGRMPNSLMLSQKFPWFDKLRVRGEVAAQETQIALTELAETELRVIEQVHLAYYDIYYYQRAIEITQENEQLLRDLVDLAQIRIRTQMDAGQQDVLRAQLELDKLRQRIIVLRRQLRVAQADLAALLHASPELLPLAMEEIHVPSAPETIDQLYAAAVRCRPELQERLHAIVRDQRQRELACLEYYPDVTLGFGWDYMTTDQAISPVADSKDNYGFMVGINLPIWQDKLRAGVREAEHRVVASARRYDATRDETFRQIRRLIAEADAYEQQIALFRENILPRAEQTLEVSITDYRGGRVDFLQVIDNYSGVLTFQ
ncbi:MAG: TolC family protein, partial [Planctomycetaceae bacterium]